MRQHTEFASEELGAGRSDCSEGADVFVTPQNTDTFPDIKFVQENGECYVKIEEYSERPKGYRDNQLFISYPLANQRRNIFCMYTLWCDQKTNVLCSLDYKQMSNFGEYGVLITDVFQLFNRIASAVDADESILKMDCRFVSYIDKMKNVMYMNPFVKPAEGYSYQNEFRLCADTNNIGLLELDTHTSFHDIAIPIRLKDFAASVTFSNGQLLFRPDGTAWNNQ